MEITAEIKFDILHWKHERREITTLDTPLQTLQKIQELEKSGHPVSEIIVTIKTSNCIFKKTFHILRYHTSRYEDFKNFRHAFNLNFH